jgi:hypothetical protein
MVVMLLLWALLFSTTSAATNSECSENAQQCKSAQDSRVQAIGRIVVFTVASCFFVWLWITMVICATCGPGVALLMWCFPSVLVVGWLYAIASLHVKT